MRQTVVALFETRGAAERARDELAMAGVAEDVRIVGAGDDETASAGERIGATEQQPRGFFDWLFGSEVPEHELQQYRTHVYESGRTLLTVMISGSEDAFERVVTVIERYDPIDIAEDGPSATGTTHGMSGTAGTGMGTAAGTGAIGTTGTGTSGSGATAGAGEETVIPTAKEELQVGKREVADTRRYRVRSYVVERPVEQAVHLRDETVTVERRAPTRSAPGGAFEEKEVEVTERREEPVIQKVVRPGEEVVIRKDVADRVETVRDTVRESKVEVDRAAAGDKPGSAAQPGHPAAGPSGSTPRPPTEPGALGGTGKKPL